MGRPVLRVLMLWIRATYRRRLIHALSGPYGRRDKGTAEIWEKDLTSAAATDENNGTVLKATKEILR